uniref:Putative ovule protein n=1 Tax=Solanum chacoense TaxID=4108 RepID=A0A0V0GX62_SOLCH
MGISSLILPNFKMNVFAGRKEITTFNLSLLHSICKANAETLILQNNTINENIELLDDKMTIRKE